MPQTLRQAIEANQPLIVPSIYDGISALVARDVGFDAVYIGSYATGATKYGLADIGYIGVEDMADQIRRLVPLVGVPVIVDAENGFGNPLHVAQSVKRLEQAGAAALHIEDHDFGKHITPKCRVLPVGKAVDKIKAALDARHSSDLMIIGRTDASGALGQEAALERAVAFQDAGADGVFLAGYGYSDMSAWDSVREAITVKVFNTDMPGWSKPDCTARGIDVVLYYGLSHFAAERAIRDAFTSLAQTGSAASLTASLPTVAEFDSFLGINKARDDAEKYGLIDPGT